MYLNVEMHNKILKGEAREKTMILEKKVFF